MAHTTLKGNPVKTSGDLPSVGQKAPAFILTTKDLKEISSDSFSGTRLLLNIFPSIDTPTCARSVQVFNKRATSLDNTTVLCVSADLPFAAKRFCIDNDIEEVIVGSTFRNPEFLDDYGIKIIDKPLAGLCARAVVVIDTDGTVLHSQLAPEISEDPDYETAIAALS